MSAPASSVAHSAEPIDYAEVSIILPALNEEQGLRDLLPVLRQLYPGAEVLVVDDGSSDNTAEVARQHQACLVQHPYRMGNGAAIKTGIRHASRKYLVMMDADGQHNPAEVENLLVQLKRYDMVVGARLEDTTSPFHRKLANWCYNRFATYLTLVPIADLTSGFRALPRALAMQFCYLLPNTFSYPTTLTLSLVRAGYSVCFTPINIRSRSGTSKIRIIRDGIRFLLIMMKVIMLFAPLRVFLPISLVCLSLGIGYGGYMILTANHFTPATLLLLVTALQTFLMGLLGEQIAQLRMLRIDTATTSAPSQPACPDEVDHTPATNHLP